MKKRIIVLGLIVLNLVVNNQMVIAQNKTEKNEQLTLVFGTIQPFLLKGWNAEIDYYSKNMVFEYSHGWSLEIKDGTVVGDALEQNLSIHIPFSTGFGVGYRITENFNVRFEGKVHQFQVYYNDESFDKNNLITQYNTTTLGFGIYYTYTPFKNQSNFLKGLTTSTSLRYWHKVNSTLNNNELSYFNRITNQQETHQASEIGIANTPWIFNVSIGYLFNMNTK